MKTLLLSFVFVALVASTLARPSSYYYQILSRLASSSKGLSSSMEPSGRYDNQNMSHNYDSILLLCNGYVDIFDFHSCRFSSDTARWHHSLFLWAWLLVVWSFLRQSWRMLWSTWNVFCMCGYWDLSAMLTGESTRNELRFLANGL